MNTYKLDLKEYFSILKKYKTVIWSTRANTKEEAIDNLFVSLTLRDKKLSKKEIKKIIYV